MGPDPLNSGSVQRLCPDKYPQLSKGISYYMCVFARNCFKTMSMFLHHCNSHLISITDIKEGLEGVINC